MRQTNETTIRIHLVLGTVPAGLMGGRLGNKGGVGVSVKFHGTRFLFINAHLAGKCRSSVHESYLKFFSVSPRRKGPLARC